MTVTEERDFYHSTLVCILSTGKITPEAQKWWDDEQMRIAEQERQKQAAIVAQKRDLRQKINDLQSQLDALK